MMKKRCTEAVINIAAFDFFFYECVIREFTGRFVEIFPSRFLSGPPITLSPFITKSKAFNFTMVRTGIKKRRGE